MGTRGNILIRSVFVCIATLVLGGCGEGKDEKAVRECMRAFDRASAARDPAAMATTLAASTFQYFDRLIPLARSGTRAQLMSLRPRERYDVIAMRHRCSAEELKRLSAPFWLKMATERGAYLDGEGETELATIKVRGDFAEATMRDGDGGLVRDGRDEPLTQLFVKEESGWKYDFQHADKFFNWVLEESAEFAGRDLNEFLLDLEGELTGTRPRGDIFDRPN